MHEEFEGLVALITGGSRGIGRATCLHLASLGASVAIHYNRSGEAAAEAARLIKQSGGRCVTLRANLTERGSCAQIVSSTVQMLGGIDILVNNAGIMTEAPVSEMTDEMWEQSLSVNLSSAFRCNRAAIAPMREKGWGRIINVSSQAAFTGSAKHAHYATSKAGLLGLTYSLAKELGGSGITVNAVAPGRILTDMLSERSDGREEEWLGQTPLGRFGHPEEVAAAIVFLASKRAGYITGTVLHVNGGLRMG